MDGKNETLIGVCNRNAVIHKIDLNCRRKVSIIPKFYFTGISNKVAITKNKKTALSLGLVGLGHKVTPESGMPDRYPFVMP